MTTNLVDLEESLKHVLPDGPNLTSKGRISPFLMNFPNLKPGKKSEDPYRFDEIFPALFKKKTGFMGARRENFNMGGPELWKSARKQVFYQEGHFDSKGSFHAPIVAYKLESQFFLSEGGILLFQEGSYQILNSSEGRLIGDGKIEVYKGIGNSQEFFLPEIKESDAKEDYLRYIAASFLSPTMALSAATNSNRYETDHVSKVAKSRVYSKSMFPKLKFNPIFEESFSTRKEIASGKFGPNYISVVTPLDNLRLFTDWCGENEVYLLDSNNLGPVKFNSD